LSFSETHGKLLYEINYTTTKYLVSEANSHLATQDFINEFHEKEKERGSLYISRHKMLRNMCQIILSSQKPERRIGGKMQLYFYSPIS
jgi:hypothetical protein